MPLRFGLHDRFSGLYKRLGVKFATKLDNAKCLAFDDDVFLMAAAVDPSFGFRWLQDHPGTTMTNEELRQKIIGM